MKEFISIFQKNKLSIIQELLKKLAESKIDYLKSDELDKVFVDFNALDTIYAVDENFIQLSPIFNRDTKDGEFVNNKLNFRT